MEEGEALRPVICPELETSADPNDDHWRSSEIDSDLHSKSASFTGVSNENHHCSPVSISIGSMSPNGVHCKSISAVQIHPQATEYQRGRWKLLAGTGNHWS